VDSVALVAVALLTGCTTSPQQPAPQPSSDTSSQIKSELTRITKSEGGGPVEMDETYVGRIKGVKVSQECAPQVSGLDAA
jgi:hypothetical protein